MTNGDVNLRVDAISSSVIEDDNEGELFAL